MRRVLAGHRIEIRKHDQRVNILRLLPISHRKPRFPSEESVADNGLGRRGRLSGTEFYFLGEVDQIFGFDPRVLSVQAQQAHDQRLDGAASSPLADTVYRHVGAEGPCLQRRNGRRNRQAEVFVEVCFDGFSDTLQKRFGIIRRPFGREGSEGVHQRDRIHPAAAVQNLIEQVDQEIERRT